MGGPKRAWGLTNHEIVIKVNLNKLAIYIIVRAQKMVTNVRFYEVLVGVGGVRGVRWIWCTIHGFICYVLYV